MLFPGNAGKRYEGAEVKPEIYFERPYDYFRYWYCQQTDESTVQDCLKNNDELLHLVWHLKIKIQVLVMS